MYGDVFGVDVDDTRYEAEKPSEALWGEMESDSDESDSDEGSEEESEDEGDQDGTGVPTQANPASQIADGLMTPSGKPFCQNHQHNENLKESRQRLLLPEVTPRWNCESLKRLSICPTLLRFIKFSRRRRRLSARA